MLAIEMNNSFHDINMSFPPHRKFKVSSMQKASEFGDIFESKEIKKIAHEVASELMNDPSLQIKVDNIQDVVNLVSSGQLQQVIEKGVNCIKKKFGESNINQQAFFDEVMKIVMKMMSQGNGDGGMPNIPNMSSLMQMFSGLAGAKGGGGATRIDDGKLRKQNQKLKLQQNLQMLKEMENKK